MAARSVDTVSPPARWLRRLLSLGIATYLTWQIVLPLRYYLRENRRDERFAWRIFSALAIAPSPSCALTVQAGYICTLSIAD